MIYLLKNVEDMTQKYERRKEKRGKEKNRGARIGQAQVFRRDMIKVYFMAIGSSSILLQIYARSRDQPAIPYNYRNQEQRDHLPHTFSLYFASSSFPTIGFLSAITAMKSFRPTFLRSFLLIFSNLLFYSSLRGIMQAYAMMLRIYEAEQYSRRSTILPSSLLERSYSTSLRFLRRSSFLASASGLEMYIILLNLRLAAESNYLGKLVAPITKISPFFGLFIPSISTKNSVFKRLEASFSLSERAVSMESISSMKMMEGARRSAAAKIFLIVFSDSPTNLLRMDEAERAKKVQPDSLASALQIQVLPLPGGPYSKIPLGGARIPVQRSGLCLGLITASSSIILTSARPTISLNDTSRFLTMASSTVWSSIFWRLGFWFLKMGFFLSSTYLICGFSQGFTSCSAFLNSWNLMLLMELEPGKPKPDCILNFWSSFPFSLAYASVLRAMNLSILVFSCPMVSLEEASDTAQRRRRIILSQQRAAYSQFPYFVQLSAFWDSAFAVASFYIYYYKPNGVVRLCTGVENKTSREQQHYLRSF